MVDWASFRGRKYRKIAYFFTPYQLVPGGGERYLLTFARTCRNLGYNVSFLVLPENYVRSIEGLHALGRKMAIDLEKMHIITVTNLNGKLEGMERNPEIFFTLGNEKYPKVEGIGQYNVFMCQFPFDLDMAPSQKNLEYLQTYDIILLNSKFTYYWYVEFMSSSGTADLVDVPAIYILYPPVPLPPVFQKYVCVSASIHIIVLGRFFEGRQSKGHLEAIEIFRHLQKRMLPVKIYLTLAGSQMKERAEDIEYTKKLKRVVGINDNINFLIDYSDDELKQLLSKSDLLWHLTGIGKNHEDPASEEHFGISVALSMGYGIIPIVFDGGAMREIVQDQVNGFLCPTMHCIIDQTEAIAYNLTKRRIMSGLSMLEAKKFSDKRFVNEAREIILQSEMNHNHLHALFF